MNSSPPSRPVGSSTPGTKSPSLAARVLNLAWPASVEQLIGNSILFADVLFVSRLGSEALAGVGLCATLIFTFASIHNSVAIAATTVVAQAKGARRYDLAERGAAQSIMLAVLLGAGSGVAGVLLSDWAMTKMGTEGLVKACGLTYMTPVLLASPLFAIAMAGGGILRGVGDTRTPMIFTLVSNATKIFLSWTLVFGKLGFPNLGVRGAALATVVCYGLNAILISAKLFHGFDSMRLRVGSFRPDRDLLAKILKLWLPVSLELLIMRAGFVFYMRVVSALGTVALAANQIAMRLESMTLSIAFGFTAAATTLVGQAVGRRDLVDAKRSTHATARLSLASMCVMTVVLILLRFRAVDMFTPGAGVRDPAIVCLVIAAFELLPLGFIFTFSGSLRGSGDTLSPMIVALVGTFVFRLPLVYLLGLKSGLGLPGIWLGTILDWIGRSIVIYLIYRTGRWKRKAVITEPGKPPLDILDAEATCRE